MSSYINRLSQLTSLQGIFDRSASRGTPNFYLDHRVLLLGFHPKQSAHWRALLAKAGCQISVAGGLVQLSGFEQDAVIADIDRLGISDHALQQAVLAQFGNNCRIGSISRRSRDPLVTGITGIIPLRPQLRLWEVLNWIASSKGMA